MTASKRLTKQSEKIILDAVRQVVSSVQEGCSPTDSVIKSARDGNLSPNFIRLVCSGYNRGATTFQRESSSNVLDKMAEFPLADAGKAIATIWATGEDKAAQAVSDAYSQPALPTNFFAKAASRALLDTPLAKFAADGKQESRPERAKMSFDRAYQRMLGMRQRLLGKRAEYAHSQDVLLTKLASLAEWFKSRPASEANAARYAAAQTLGKSGEAVMEYVICRNATPRLPREKMAAFFNSSPIDWKSSPYADIRQCIDAAREMMAEKAGYSQFAKHAEASVQEELLRPFAGSLTCEARSSRGDSVLESRRPVRKHAFFNSGLFSGMVGAQVNQAGREYFKTRQDRQNQRISSLAAELDDPLQDYQMRQVQAQTMLHDFLSDDPILSGYEPSQVISAYNELAQLSPLTAGQPAYARAWLRRHLAQGAPETFEAKELADVEKTLTDTRDPGKGMAPDRDIYKMGILCENREHVASILDPAQ